MAMQASKLEGRVEAVLVAANLGSILSTSVPKSSSFADMA